MQIPRFRLIAPDVRVYLYYAGRSRRYMAISRFDHSVFLDIPGFVTNKDTFDSDDQIVRSLKRADAVRKNMREPNYFPSPRGLSSYDTRKH
jgi:hypothetical protein